MCRLFFVFVYVCIDSYVKNLESVAVLKTVDYHGNPRVTGGDPVSVILHRDVDPESIVIKTEVIDNDDGTYHVKFRPTITGRYNRNTRLIMYPCMYVVCIYTYI